MIHFCILAVMMIPIILLPQEDGIRWLKPNLITHIIRHQAKDQNGRNHKQITGGNRRIPSWLPQDAG